MRNIGITAWLLLTVLAVPAAAEEFPYPAYVTADDVYVRSGPGRSYYPTDKLAKGAEVEVYRHDPGGWYAIRPPQGSFSWVSSRYIEQTEGSLGVVTEDEVVARVGSQLSSVRDVIQVRLEPREIVEIVGEHEAGGQLWYKIAAPAGEFRWISSDYLDREPPPDGVGKPRRRPKTHFAQQQTAPASPPTIPLATVAEPVEAEEPVRLVADGQEPGRLPEDVEQTSRPIANRLVRQIEQQTAAEGKAGAEIETVGHNEPAEREVVRIAREDTSPRWRAPNEMGTNAQAESRSASLKAAARSAPPRLQPSQRSFESELKAIDLELSEMVAEEPTVWAFGELNQRIEALLGRTSTALERGEARRLQHQIARLEDIKSRYRQVGAVLDETDRRNSQLERRRAAPRVAPAPQSATQASLTAPSVSVDTQFDGQGVLRPVVSRRQDAPRYALVDQQGEVLSFLTPAPGLNLQSYLGTTIGVLGTRGYMPELRKPHVMVQRVEPLDVTVVR